MQEILTSLGLGEDNSGAWAGDGSFRATARESSR
jgi:hypothetical protein